MKMQKILHPFYGFLCLTTAATALDLKTLQINIEDSFVIVSMDLEYYGDPNQFSSP